MKPEQKALESRLRRRANKLGLYITKSWSMDDACGFPAGYRIIRRADNDILAGSCDHDLLLQNLSAILDQMEKEIEEFGDIVSIWD